MKKKKKCSHEYRGEFTVERGRRVASSSLAKRTGPGGRWSVRKGYIQKGIFLKDTVRFFPWMSKDRCVQARAGHDPFQSLVPRTNRLLRVIGYRWFSPLKSSLVLFDTAIKSLSSLSSNYILEIFREFICVNLPQIFNTS